MKAIERLYQYFDCKGIKPTRFEKDFELSNGYFGTQLKRNGHLGEDVINKIIDNFLDLNPLWLISGKGKMLLNEPNIEVDLQKQVLVPFFDDIEKMEADINIDLRNKLNTGDFFKNANMVIRINGTSMSDAYGRGTLVAGKRVFNKDLLVYGKDYVIFTDEYRIIRRIQKSEQKEFVLECAINMQEWEKGSLKGRLIYDPFDLEVKYIKELYELVGKLETL
jgi:hypothetical protein